MHAEINILKQMVEPLTMMLSGSNVQVSFRGSEAMTVFGDNGKPERIILPMISGDADPSIVAAYQGYLDHEVGHVMFTDMPKELPNEDAVFFNIVEDARIEKEMCRRFRGSQFNLKNVYELVFPKEAVGKLAEDDELHKTISYALMSVRALSGQEYFKDLVESFPDLKTFCEDLREKFEAKINAVSTSQEAVDLGREIKGYLGIEFPESDEASPKSGDSDSDSEGSSDGDAEASEKDSDDDKKKEGKPSKSKEGKKDGRGEDKSSSTIKKIPKDAFESLVSEKLKKIAEDLTESADYRVYSTDYDRVDHLPITDVGNGVLTMESDTRQMVGAIQKNLERVIAARSMIVWNGGFRSGKINQSVLSRLVTGDDHVFRRKQESISKDVAVTLLIDCSGSMAGEKMDLAAISAYALSTVLNRMGITYEVIGFTTGSEEVPIPPGKKTSYARYQSIYMPIFKSFTDRWDASAKNRLVAAQSYYSRTWLWNNVDGECVQIAANRLIARPEKGKIMIVLSDGLPCADGANHQLSSHLAKVVNEVSKKIDIIGIGIKSEYVKRYYKKWVVLNRIADLPQEVIKSIRGFLLK